MLWLSAGVAIACAGCSNSSPSAAASGSGATAAAQGDSTGADLGFGEAAFKTFESDGTRIVFTSDKKAKIMWHNMSGKDVVGTYTQSGRNLEIKWDPATNYHMRIEKFRQMGPCSMADYERTDDKGVVHDDSPWIYQQVEPHCDTVRLTK
ncbi:MAG: hypothetical protein NT062_21930 [Proteobacteria bacterium]|nr:hypothetical protein [Pseudomonadota bacterium]